MAEEKKTPAKEKFQKQEETEVLVRILGYDIPGSKALYAGLTRIKGVSWGISNALCLRLGLDKNTKISTLSKADISKIESSLKNLDIPIFMKNRRLDPETGESVHLYGTDLTMKSDFDIKRMRKIRSYKGIRHASKLPVRGQRTRSHFRTKGRQAVGVRRKK